MFGKRWERGKLSLLGAGYLRDCQSTIYVPAEVPNGVTLATWSFLEAEPSLMGHMPHVNGCLACRLICVAPRVWRTDWITISAWAGCAAQDPDPQAIPWMENLNHQSGGCISSWPEEEKKNQTNITLIWYSTLHMFLLHVLLRGGGVKCQSICDPERKTLWNNRLLCGNADDLKKIF